MELIKQVHHLFWDGSYYLYLYVFACVYLIWRRKENKNAFWLLCVNSIIMLVLVISNPIVGRFLDTFFYGGALTVVRVYFIFPLYPLLAYVASDIVSNAQNGIKRVVAFMLVSSLVIVSGSTFFDTFQSHFASNRFKINDEVIAITQTLEHDQPQGDINIILDTEGMNSLAEIYEAKGRMDYIATGLRSYSSRIKIVSGFNGLEIYDQKGEMDLWENLGQLENVEYNYLVLRNNDDVVNVCEKYGMSLVSKQDNYSILKRKIINKDDVSITLNERRITIDGLSKEYHIAMLNDMHIICPDTSIKEDQRDFIKSRYTEFAIDSNGIASSLRWDKFTQKINDMSPDIVVNAGDMVDEISSSNINCLKKGLDNFNCPVIYIRSNHDYETKWSNYTATQAEELQKSVVETPMIWKYDFDEFLVVAIENNIANITSEQLETLKKLLTDGKPVILFCHVPYEGENSTKLSDDSRAIRGRAEMWGADMVPDENTKEFMEILYDKNSSVQAVFTGHLHFNDEVELNDHSVEYVMAPSYAGNVGWITVTGK